MQVRRAADLEYVIEAAGEDEEGEKSFRELEYYLTEAKVIIVEQHEVKNYNSVKSVERSFNGVRKFVDDIKHYRQQPRRNHNENTFFQIRLCEIKQYYIDKLQLLIYC